VADDWRLTIAMPEEEHGLRIAQRLHAHEVEDDVRDRLGGAVSVSREGSDLFVYADTEGQAREAEAVVREVLAAEGLEADITLDRWHPLELAWEDASVPLPSTQEDIAEEEARRADAEAAESLAEDAAQWEVRLDVGDHGEAVRLAERLEAEGLPVTRRWTHLIVGAVNREEAEALADRLRGESPQEVHVEVEPGGAMVWEVRRSNPFAIFGGLGN
jgi:hypothetical protein